MKWSTFWRRLDDHGRASISAALNRHGWELLGPNDPRRNVSPYVGRHPWVAAPRGGANPLAVSATPWGLVGMVIKFGENHQWRASCPIEGEGINV